MLKGCQHLTRTALNTLKRNPLSQYLNMTTEANEKPVETTIHSKLSAALSPQYLEVINESPMHNVPKGSESHFKVVVVSDLFDNVALIKRHRMVNDALKEELETTVHALSISAKTVKQWEDSGHKITKSPPCMGGAGL